MNNCPNCNKEVPEEFDVCWNCSYNFITKVKEGFVSDKIDTESAWVNPKELNCIRCKTTMKFEETIKLHEGKNWGIIGDLGHMLTHKTSFDFYVCPNCDKVEFFTPSVTRRL